MQRLTEKDDLGHWFLKGLEWGQLREGQVITKKVSERLYGALCKLKDYEDTGCSPDGIADLVENYAKAMTLLVGQIEEHSWIPVEERLPDEDEYVLISFENFTLPAIGRYEINDKGDGAWYLGSCDEEDTCISEGLFVNAWIPLPKAYRAEVEAKPDASADWKGHYMDRFEKVE